MLFSVDAGDVGDCARTATLSVHVAIAAAIVRILRDIRFSSPHPRKRFSIPCACVLRGRRLSLSRDIVRIVDQPRNSRALNTCPSVSIDIPNDPKRQRGECRCRYELCGGPNRSLGRATTSDRGSLRSLRPGPCGIRSRLNNEITDAVPDIPVCRSNPSISPECDRTDNSH
jgi:hypothetical protein